MTRPAEKTRCAVYTRKSTEEGLNQAFNSLDAQRQAGEHFIASQATEGWLCLPDHYDDGGYTGGNVERPALQRLLDDVKAGAIDCVVVYKVDRLSRSLLDFARIMAIFDEHDVAFVSVTQSFNSATSMGRLTLNILLSFAQFEREVISERTRDKIQMARKKGKWAGGCPVLGYDLVPGGGRIEINAIEAEQVRTMFDLYLQLGGLITVIEELDRRGWTNKTWVTRAGKLHPGKPFIKSSLHRLLTNPIYLGKVRHHGVIYEGEHKAIVEASTFEKVQELLAQQDPKQEKRDRFRGQGILTGILRCKTCDCGMVQSHTGSGSRHRRYYLCYNAQSRGWSHCPRPTLPAKDMEGIVVQEIRAIGQDPHLAREVLEESQAIYQRDMDNLKQQQRMITQELADYHRRANAFSTRPHDPDAVTALLGATQRIEQLEQDGKEVQVKLAELRTGALDEAMIREACRRFNPIWDTLSHQEQRRLLELLIERVEYDDQAGTIAISFHPTGIQTLANETNMETTA